jgi:hypothetical protein
MKLRHLALSRLLSGAELLAQKCHLSRKLLNRGRIGRCDSRDGYADRLGCALGRHHRGVG